MLLEEERVREGERRVEEEELRRKQMVTKTARLRELRLAKEAEERIAAAVARARQRKPRKPL
jgi:hypothetical protein